MIGGNASVALPSERTIVITRVFDAPRAVVFDTWTNADHVRHWWDPSRVPLATCEIDLRVGGAFRFVNAGPHARTFRGTYRAIDRPTRLVFTTPSPSGGESTGTLVFTTHDGTTMLTMTIECASRIDRDALLALRVDAGTLQTLANLAEYLGHQGSKG